MGVDYAIACLDCKRAVYIDRIGRDIVYAHEAPDGTADEPMVLAVPADERECDGSLLKPVVTQGLLVLAEVDSDRDAGEWVAISSWCNGHPSPCRLVLLDDGWGNTMHAARDGWPPMESL